MLTSVRPFLRTLSIPVLAAAALLTAPAALAEDFNFPGLKDTVTVYEDATRGKRNELFRLGAST